MVLEKIPTFGEVKSWVNNNTATSVNGKTGDVTVDTSQPITQTDKAESFTESDVTVSSTSLGVENGRLGLGGTFTGGTANGSTDWSGTVSWSGYKGWKISPKVEGIISLEFQTSGYDGNWSTIHLIRTSNEEILGSVNGSRGDYLTISRDDGKPLDPAESYAVVAEAGASVPFISGANWPVSTPEIDVPGAWDGAEETNYNLLIESMTPVISGNSGTATIEWEPKDTVVEWDMCSHNKELRESGIVDVFIEESTDGGATWNEIAGPISQTQEINAPNTSQIRYRVDLDKNGSLASPYLESIYRRRVV